MKSILAFAFCLAFLVSAQAQKMKSSDVPKPIRDSFTGHFKNCKVEKWEKEKNGTYEAEFHLNKIETTATFSAEGELLETETGIKADKLPAAATEYIAKNYQGYKIQEAASIRHASGSQYYEAEITNKKERREIIFNESGTFVKEMNEEEENEDPSKE